MSQDSKDAELRRRKPAKQPDTDNSDNDEPDPDEKPAGPPKSPMEIAQEKYRKFFTRSIWGSLMIVVFALILYLGHAFVSVFVVLMQVMVFKEIISLRYIEAKERKLWGFRTLHWFFLFGSIFYVYGGPIIGISTKLIRRLGFNVDIVSRLHLLLSFVFYVIGFVGFIATLKRGSLKYQFGQLTWTLMTLLIVIGQSNFIIQNIWKGLFWFLLPCSLIICNDIMAYMCGLAAGRVFIKRPLTSLSPNKTWEGFVGALFCTLAWAFVFSSFLAQYEWFVCPKEITGELSLNVGHCTPDLVFLPRIYELPQIVVLLLSRLGYHYTTVELLPVQLHALILALFASLIAPFGGFFASGMKRAYGVKDFDSLFPGHGGVTDRMDCQFIMGFFAYVYHTVVISSGVNNVPQLIYAISQLPPDDQMLIFNSLKQSLKL